MNHSDAWRSGGRRGSCGRGQPSGKWVVRNKDEILDKVDKPLDESSGNRSSGSRGRGRCRTSSSPRNSPRHEQFDVKKQDSVEDVGPEDKGVVQHRKSIQDETGFTTVMKSRDNKDLLQSSASSSSKKTNLSGGSSISRESDENGGRLSRDLLQSSTSSSSEKINLSRGSSISRESDENGATLSRDVLQSSTSSSSKKINLSGGSSFSRKSEENKARLSCDLFNQIDDVGLYSQESGFSTSSQKVEVCNSAHKSGGKGNSSEESSMRPSFDIFLKRGQGLKPSFLVINREKKKAAKGYTGVVIRPGMVLLKNYLSIDDQVMIVKKCRELGLGEGGFYQPGYEDGAVLHLKMMCLGKNWDPQTSQYGETRPVDGSIPPQIPVEFRQLVGKSIKESQSVVATSTKKMREEDGIPDMSPDICIVNFYSSTGRLGLHQDKDESKTSIQKGLPVVSFSIGDSAEFLYSDHRDADKADMVKLESGDVILFGGKSRNVFHGVRSILKDTAPKVLTQETSLRPGRLNLTFRQY